MIVDTATVIGGLSAGGAAAGGFAVYMRRFRREQNDVRNVVLGEEARPGIPARPGVLQAISELHSAVDNIAVKVNSAALLNGKGDLLVATATETRELVTVHTAATNANVAGLRDDIRVIGNRQVELITGLRTDREKWRHELQQSGVDVPTDDHLPEI